MREGDCVSVRARLHRDQTVETSKRITGNKETETGEDSALINAQV